MKIALIGYGKMGKMMEQVARETGDVVVHTMDVEENPLDKGFSGEWTTHADVLIDFSVAKAVPQNVKNAVNAKIPIVVGVTGWYAQLEQVKESVEEGSGACIYSSNFSIGVQVLFYLSREAAKLFSRFEEYHPYLVDIHHSEKVDSPSGTSVRLQGFLEETYKETHEKIPVTSIRVGYFPGIHVVGFDSPVDNLKLEHTARSREGFARGALFAGKWIQDKRGFHSFDEIIFGQEHG
ncbi:MAG: 4-hydroxy-tetrahydrodipicolinate reductase [Acidobacteriota bacterium]